MVNFVYQRKNLYALSKKEAEFYLNIIEQFFGGKINKAFRAGLF